MEEKKNIDSWESIEKAIAEKMMTQNDTLAKSVIEQAKRATKCWFIAFLVTLAALVGTNAAWLYVFNSYEYVYQDGEGQNNYNNNIDGDVDNVTTD